MEPMASPKIVQMNLHQAQAASAIIAGAISKDNIGIVLAQKP